MNLQKIVISIICATCSRLATAQMMPTIKASVDKTRVLIGEPLVLTVEATQPADATRLFVNIDSIAHFELLAAPAIDTTVNASDGVVTIRGIYKITSFDSGHWVIPSFTLSPAVRTDTLPVDVVFSDFDPNQDYHDIKDILPVKPVSQKNWGWYIAGAALLLIVVTIFLWRRRKKPALVPSQPLTDPYTDAIQQLEALHQKKLAPKVYYTGMVNVFRVYISRKKGISSLQETTGDLIVQLGSLNLEKDSYAQLAQTLRLSDFVKFAKYNPAPDDDENLYRVIRQAIMNIEKSASKKDG